MKKILLSITILVISVMQLNAIKSIYIDENTQLLRIENDTVISETIEFKNNLIIQGQNSILVDNNGIMIHSNPTLHFENESKIIIHGTVYIKNINIPQISSLQAKIIAIIPIKSDYIF